LAGLIVTLIAESKDIDQIRIQRGGELHIKSVGIHERSAGMFKGTAGPAVLLCLSREALRIVSRGDLVIGVQLVIDLAEISILIEGAVVVADAWLQVIDRRDLICCGRRRQSDQHRISRGVALAVVIEKEEEMVLDDGTAHAAAKLIEMVSRL